jgi:CHAT domain-containing protein
VVVACCHGVLNRNFLRSRLILAQGQTLSLGQALAGQSGMEGLRLLVMSACQTAVSNLRAAYQEVRSLAVGMLQAGARAVLASLWPVDDRATYLLMIRFMQEWLPVMEEEEPARALVRAQTWLRTVTNRELGVWTAQVPVDGVALASEARSNQTRHELVTSVRGGGDQSHTYDLHPDAILYADPIYSGPASR